MFFYYDSTKAVSLVVFLINVESYILIIAVCLEFPRNLYFLKKDEVGELIFNLIMWLWASDKFVR